MSEKNELSVIANMQPTEQSLLAVVGKFKGHLLKRACETIRAYTKENQEAFLMRTVSNIVKNEKLKECFNSPEGRYSIFNIV